MAVAVLNQVPPQWQRHLCDLGNAIRPIVARPVQLQAAMDRWAMTEPDLAGVSQAQLFDRLGSMNDPQVRALIRIARSEDPEAEVATWAVVCQFIPAIMSVARADYYSRPGAGGRRAAAATAVADLWTHIHHINLETNQASIFFAIAARLRRSTAPTGRDRRSADRLPCDVVDPALFAGERIEADDEDDPFPLFRWREGMPPSWLRPDPAGGAGAFEEVDRRIVLTDAVEQLSEALTDEMAEFFNWNPGHRLYEGQRRRLRAYLHRRMAAAAAGTEATGASIAAEIGASYETIRDLQKEVNRALRVNADRYRPVVLASLDELRVEHHPRAA